MNKKLALITDTHLGVRNNHPFFLKKQKQFFEEVFFPTIDNEEIQTVIHLGDVFDKRSTLNYTVFDESKSFFFDELNKRNLDVHIIVGNHDVPYRNTNFPNAPQLLLETGYNFKVYAKPSQVKIYDENLIFIPWVNVENTVQTQNLIEVTDAKMLFGHLEIIGFQMLKGQRADHGFDRKSLKKFDKVFSGHFHHRSQEDNIWYLGNPYETTWADFENSKGLHILDLEDYSLRFIENQNTSHVYVNKVEDIIESKFGDMIVKVDLTNMTDDEVEKVYKKIEKFEKRPESLLFINKTNFVDHADANTDDLMIKTTKDILNEYIDSLQTENKDYSELKSLLGETYDRALDIT